MAGVRLRASLSTRAPGITEASRQDLLQVLTAESREPLFSTPNERPVELSFLFRWLSRLYPASILDVGAGLTATPHLMANCGFRVVATDHTPAYWSRPVFNRHFLVVDDDITCTRIREKFDLVTCVSTLEHITQASAAVRGMASRLNPGGHLLITAPFCRDKYIENVNASAGCSKPVPSITQAFSEKCVVGWTNDNGLEEVDREEWRCWTGPHWSSGKKLLPPLLQGEAQLICLLFRKTSREE